ncbi:MAG TPA: S9 family peptidase [Thermoanaerobaculia bacterium]
MKARVSALAAFAAASFLVSSPGRAEKRKLTIEDLTAEPPVAGRPVTAVTWIGRGERFSYVVRKGSGDDAASELWVEETATGRKTMVATGSALALPDEPGTETPPGEKKTAKGRTASLDGYAWSPDGRRVLVSGAGDLWIYDVAARRLERITQTAEREELPSFSPDGRRVAFVRGNDLYAVDVDGHRETRLTRDGGELVYNGRLDWVYEEELANRDARGYEWSPDGRSIAYLRLDDTPVAPAPLVDYLAVPAKVDWQRYPKAGGKNPIATFHVVGVDGAERGAARPENDSYVVPGFSWTPDSASVSYRVVNRAQNREEVRLYRPGPGADDAASRTLFVEEDRSWVNVFDPPRFLPDGRYVWKSERTGFAHLFVGRTSGGALQPITSGEWIVDKVTGVDGTRGIVYFTATEENVRRRPIYRVALDGTGFRKITASARGQHSPELSPDGRFLLDTYSSVSEPPVLSLLESSGKTVRVVDRPQTRLDELDLATTEEVRLPADDGTRLEGRLTKPADFDPSKKYPVIVFVYGGPHSQVVRDAWGATSLLDHLLASRGFLVWSVDNRGSFGRGHAWESALSRDMGRHELADQLAGVRYLKSLPFVDPARIGIWGWSYGGYMTLYSLTRAPGVWKCGIAGAPVTHWKFYDTVYTERYMGTPQDNPDGYERSAPLSKAGDLAVPLLLIHGGSDDNVHLQNSLAFVDALVKAGRPYDLQVQPRQKHGFRGAESLNLRNRAIVRFFEENLQ